MRRGGGKKSSVRVRELTAEEVSIPSATRTIGGHRVVRVDAEAEAARSARLERQGKRLAVPKATMLDGFVLLEACGVEFPDEGHRADVSGYGASRVAETDLDYFPRLACLDCSENSLPLVPLARLPRLKELKMAANGLRFIDPRDDEAAPKFYRLLSLDLSYNALTVGAIQNLAAWTPNLRELDLTGNQMQELPQDMARFESLEKLVLERNGFRGENVWRALALVSNLRDLQLSHNQITKVPPLEKIGDPLVVFKELQTLGLAYNAIESLDAVRPLSLYPKLDFLSLYGNPLVQHAGKPQIRHACFAADALTAAALKARDGWTDRRMDVATEAPVSKAHTRFRNLTMARVSKGRTMTSAADFRTEGNKTLFFDQRQDDKDEEHRDDDLFVPEQHTVVPEQHNSRFADDDLRVDPSLLLARTIEPHRKTDPTKLKTALRALRHVLDHPLTTHLRDEPTERGGQVPFAARTTLASKHRRLPRRPYSTNLHPADDDEYAKLNGQARLQRGALRDLDAALDDINADLLRPSPPIADENNAA